MEDDCTYVSVINGRIGLGIDDRIEITKLFIVEGNLDITVGNVKFDGDIHAAEDVTAKFLEGATVNSEGNINAN